MLIEYFVLQEKRWCKIFKIDKGNVLNKWDQVFSGIKYHIEKISGEEVAIRKMIYFPTLAVVIRCIFKQNVVFYPQFYLNDCLYQI